MSRLNDASVNASIRLYLRVMIIIRQERHNKARQTMGKKGWKKVWGEEEMKLLEWNLHLFWPGSLSQIFFLSPAASLVGVW